MVEDIRGRAVLVPVPLAQPGHQGLAGVKLLLGGPELVHEARFFLPEAFAEQLELLDSSLLG